MQNSLAFCSEQGLLRFGVEPEGLGVLWRSAGAYVLVPSPGTVL